MIIKLFENNSERWLMITAFFIRRTRLKYSPSMIYCARQTGVIIENQTSVILMLSPLYQPCLPLPNQVKNYTQNCPYIDQS